MPEAMTSTDVRPPDPGLVAPADWRRRVASLPHAVWTRWRSRATELLDALGRPPTADEIRGADRRSAAEMGIIGASTIATPVATADEAIMVAVRDAEERRARRLAQPPSDRTSDALQCLVGMLAAKPTPLRTILAGAEEFRISRRAIFEAAALLEVIKTTLNDEEVWDLEQGDTS